MCAEEAVQEAAERKAWILKMVAGAGKGGRLEQDGDGTKGGSRRKLE